MTSNDRARISALNLDSFNRGERDALAHVEEVVVFSLPMNIRFRGITVREGLLLRGPAGWGECAPFWNYDADQSAVWLASALEQATTFSPLPVRSEVPVNATIPVCSPEVALARLSNQPGCFTAKVKVADPGFLTDEDVERVRVVAGYLSEEYGSAGRVRIDANTAWGVDEAAWALDRLNSAAQACGGLEYAEQPVRGALELRDLRGKTTVPIAADESIRLSADPLAVKRLDAADVAVLKVAPLGGIQAAAELSVQIGLPAVVSSALDTSIGIGAGVELAASLPILPYACGLNTATMFAADVVDEPYTAVEGTLDVGRARQLKNAELTTHADFVDPDVVESWSSRLRLMIAALNRKRK